MNNQGHPPVPHQRASFPQSNQRTLGSLLEPKGRADSDPHRGGCQVKQQEGETRSVGRVVSQATFGGFTSETWSTVPFLFLSNAGLSTAPNKPLKIHSFKEVKPISRRGKCWVRKRIERNARLPGLKTPLTLHVAGQGSLLLFDDKYVFFPRNPVSPDPVWEPFGLSHITARRVVLGRRSRSISGTELNAVYFLSGSLRSTACSHLAPNSRK